MEKSIKISIELKGSKVSTSLDGTKEQIYAMLKTSLKGGALREFVALAMADIMTEEAEELIALVEESQITIPGVARA